MGIFQVGSGGLEAYDITFTSVSDQVDGTGSVDIIDVTETGLLIGIGVVVSTNVTGTPTSVLEITVDGGTLRSLKVYDGATNWAFDGLMNFADGSHLGATLGNKGVLWLHSRYASSLKVSHNVTGAGSAGAISVGVIRGTKL